jgi:HEAT repeat protein
VLAKSLVSGSLVVALATAVALASELPQVDDPKQLGPAAATPGVATPQLAPQEPPKPTPAALAPAVERARAALIAETADANDRRRAAQELFVTDPAFLAERLRGESRDEVVVAILDAVAIQASPQDSGVRLVEPVIGLLRQQSRRDVVAKARETLRAMDRADMALRLPAEFRIRESLYAELRSSDPTAVRVACLALADLGDLRAAERMVGLLESTAAGDAVAEAAAEGLEALLYKSYGRDAAKWREHLAALSTQGATTYVAVLRATLLAERAASEEEVLQLKIALDQNDPKALIADLTHRLAAVRTFAATTLTRRIADWEVQGARTIVIENLKQDGTTQEVAIAFLGLLDAIDRKLQRLGPDPARDAAIVQALRSDDSAIVAAAARNAQSLPVDAVREAILAAVSLVAIVPETPNGGDSRPLSPEARTALVTACGALGLASSVDSLIAILRGDPSDDVRVAAASALGTLKDERARVALSRALRGDTNWRVRRRAAKELVAVGLGNELPALLAALDDARPEVRSEAALALASLELPAAEVEPALLERLRTETNNLADLVRAVGRIGTERSLEPLCEVAARVKSLPSTEPAAVDLFLRDLREAIERIAGDDLGRWRRAGAAFERLEQPALAVFALTHPVRILIARGAPTREVQEARIDLAVAALAARDYAAADAVTADGLAVDGVVDSRYALLLYRADALVGLGKVADALPIYDQLLGPPSETLPEPSPELARLAVHAAAAANTKVGDFERVVELLAGLPERDLDTDLLLARAEQRTGRLAAARDRLRTLRAIAQPRSGFELEVRLELAATLAKLGDLAAARLTLPSDAELPPDLPADLAARLDTLRTELANPGPGSGPSPSPTNGSSGSSGNGADSIPNGKPAAGPRDTGTSAGARSEGLRRG